MSRHRPARADPARRRDHDGDAHAPPAGLDLSHQHAALASARRRADRGLGVLAVLHDLNMAARYADRVAIMEGGRVTALGPTPEVLDPVRLSAVFATPIARVEANGRTAFLSLG
jgi:iron complex transport system ATP-binding protein